MRGHWTDHLQVRLDDEPEPVDIGTGVLVALGFIAFVLWLFVSSLFKAGERFK